MSRTAIGAALAVLFLLAGATAGWAGPSTSPSATSSSATSSASASSAASTDPALPTGLTAVDGGAKGHLAVPVTTGRYLDHVAPTSDDGFNFYSITRTIPGSTIDFGATLLRDQGYRRGNRLSVVLAYLRPVPGHPGKTTVVRCGKAEHGDASQRAMFMPLVTNAGYSLNQRTGCGTRKDLLLAVYATSSANIPAGTPYELDVWETPPVTNLARLPPSGFGSTDTVPVTQPVTTTVPAPWMEQAPVIAGNQTTYAQLPLGRISWFAVDVPFNHELDAIATLADPSGADGGAGVEMKIVGATGGVVSFGSIDSDRFKETATLGAAPVTVESHGYLVSPAARVGTTNVQGFEGGQALSANPGVYYVALYAANNTGDPTATVPITLTAGLLRGTGLDAVGAKAATYAAAVPAFPAPTGPRPVAYRAGSMRSDEGPGLAAPSVLLGVAVLLVVAGVVVLLASRRRRAAPEL